MANLVDYVKWRGDLSVVYTPLNFIDIVLFSQISMLDFTDIASGKNGKTLGQVAGEYFKEGRDKMPLGLIVPAAINGLFYEMSKQPRYSEVVLSNAVHRVNEKKEEQFYALTIDFPKIKTRYISFGGTDDTLVGWKENFNMIYRWPTSAQKDSVKYLDSVCSKFRGKLYVLGHSKGGNLALYSSIHCSDLTQKHIAQVVNIDGPGVSEIELGSDGYKRIYDRLVSLIPQGSIVGRLFEHREKRLVVKSENEGLYQHDCFSWQLNRDTFEYADDVDQDSEDIDKTVRNILLDMDENEREDFVTALFLLFTSNAKTLLDVTQKKTDLITAYMKMDYKTKRTLNAVSMKLLKDKAVRKLLMTNIIQFNRSKNTVKQTAPEDK